MSTTINNDDNEDGNKLFRPSPWASLEKSRQAAMISKNKPSLTQRRQKRALNYALYCVEDFENAYNKWKVVADKNRKAKRKGALAEEAAARIGPAMERARKTGIDNETLKAITDSIYAEEKRGRFFTWGTSGIKEPQI